MTEKNYNGKVSGIRRRWRWREKNEQNWYVVPGKMTKTICNLVHDFS